MSMQNIPLNTLKRLKNLTSVPLEVGNVVELKSGGDFMTVKSILVQEEEDIICVFFVNGELKEETFVNKTLKKKSE